MNQSVLRSAALAAFCAAGLAFSQSGLDQCTAYWSFNHSYLPYQIIDEMGNNHDLIVVDGIVNASVPRGPFGRYLLVNGDGCKMTAIESAGKFNSPVFTFATYVSMRSTSQTQTLFQNSSVINGVVAGYRIQIAAGGNIQIAFGDSASANWNVITTAAAIPLNQVTHLALSYDGTSVRTYLNGLPAETSAYTYSFSAGSGPAIVGGSVINGKYENMFKNKIDEIFIYSRVLSDDEVYKLVNPDMTGTWAFTQTDRSHTPWTGSLQLTQYPDYSISGSAEMPDSVDHLGIGAVQGSIVNGIINLTVSWQSNFVGEYQGMLSGAGFLMQDGNTYEQSTPGHIEQWSAKKVSAIPTVTGCWTLVQSNMASDTGTLFNLVQDQNGNVSGNARFHDPALQNGTIINGTVSGQIFTFSIDWGGNVIGDYSVLIGLDATTLRHGRSAMHGGDLSGGVAWTGSRIACQ
jgi:hypothetical protein